MRKKITISAFFFLWAGIAFAQYPSLSISTDLGLVRNFSKEQRFIALHNTIRTDFHLTMKDGIQVSFGYSTAGKYINSVTATALDPGTVPQKLDYDNKGKMRIRLLTASWKHYLKGHPQTETSWNLYSRTGFGLLMGWVDNIPSRSIDTSLYHIPVKSGNANFKRLTLDLAVGWEKPLGADFHFYTEARVSVPSPGYPSPFLLVNDHAPFMAVVCGGLRILF